MRTLDGPLSRRAQQALDDPSALVYRDDWPYHVSCPCCGHDVEAHPDPWHVEQHHAPPGVTSDEGWCPGGRVPLGQPPQMRSRYVLARRDQPDLGLGATGGEAYSAIVALRHERRSRSPARCLYCGDGPATP